MFLQVPPEFLLNILKCVSYEEAAGWWVSCRGHVSQPYIPRSRPPCQNRLLLGVSSGPVFRLRSSTFVLLKIEPILYPESYCYLGLTRIHSLCHQEDFFDRL